jgi:hypothetical protein
VFQKEYENLINAGNEALFCHVSAVYIIHSHFKSNWQDNSAVEAAFSAETAAKSDILGSFFSQLFQAAVNLTVKIEKRFGALVSNSESEAAENGYMRTRFYDICDKEKVAVCRLKHTAKVDANLSIDNFEIFETLPYKSGMEREAFLEYLQSLFDNGLTLEHLVLVRRKNLSGITTVTAYKVDVCDWNTKPIYVNFEIKTFREAKKYYLRLVSNETLDTGSNDGIEKEAIPQPPNDTKSDTPSVTTVPTIKNVAKHKRKGERTDVLEKVSRIKEDMKNKTC